MDNKTISSVMSELGRRSWEARKKKFGEKVARGILSRAGVKGQKVMRKNLKKRAKLK